LRIIAGELKGRKLVSPKDEKVRPTSDKVKEAIFSMIADSYYDETVIDLFAGTGNLGIEAISRGAKHCYFPPYKEGLMISCIELINDLDLLTEDGYIIAEHSLEEKLPETVGKYQLIKEKRYGKIAVSIYG